MTQQSRSHKRTPRALLKRPIVIVAFLLLLAAAWFNHSELATAWFGRDMRGQLPTTAEAASASAQTAAQTAAAKVAQAWDNVRNSDRYAFSADVTIKTIPLPTASNIGRFSKTDSLYVEGVNDLRAKDLQLALWGGQVNVTNQDAAYQMRVKNGEMQTRAGDGEWKATDDTGITALAPDGDFLAFLDVAKNLNLANDRRPAPNDAACAALDCAGLSIYTFDLDGHAYADKLARLSQQQLQRSGHLPLGASIQTPAHLTNISGSGELWVDARNLPVRQKITLSIPSAPNSDNRSETVMDVHFTDYRANALVQASAPLLQPVLRSMLNVELPSPSTVAMNLGLLALVALSLLVLVRPNPRTRLAINFAVLMAMVFGPALQAHANTMALERFRSDRAKQVAAEEAHVAKQSLLDARQSVANAAPYVPDVAAVNALANVAAPGSGPAAPANPSAALDSDGDGLNDDVEAMIGSDPLGSDTDNDTVSDLDEVNGFAYSNKRWYGNPLLADSNGDGAIDSVEWNPSAPDTDADSTPDLYDFDDDGDGVPDSTDISRLVASKDNAGTLITFSETNPLTLTLEGVQTNRYTYVNLQVRPTNPKQLWYAFNVLNWPKDEKGNVQDWDNKTLYDHCVKTSGSNCHLSPDDNGDIKLVPMLEVAVSDAGTLPRTSGGAIDKTLLGRYGISAQPSGNGGYLLYVPLNVVEDSLTGNKVAFSAQLIYRLASAWKPQQVRMSWVVQLLNETYASPDEAKKALAAGNGSGSNQLTILHAYYTDFQLTGLNVREDHGVDMAIVYEDPATDNNVNEDEALIHMIDGLETTFLSNRDCDFVDNTGACVGDGQRDITIPALKARFDRLSNTGVTEGQRWGIPQNRLRVETASYAHEDEAVMTSGGQTAPNILNAHFSNSPVLTPSLLFVRETRFRATNLDVRTAAGDSSVTWSGNSVKINLAGQNEIVTGGYVLSSYRRGATNNSWTRVLPEEQVKSLESRYPVTAPPASNTLTVTQGTQAAIVYVTIVATQGNEMVLSQNGQTGLGTALSGNGAIGGIRPADITDDGLRRNYVNAIAAVGGALPYLALNAVLKINSINFDTWSKLIDATLQSVGKTKLAAFGKQPTLKQISLLTAELQELRLSAKFSAAASETTRFKYAKIRQLSVAPLLLSMALGVLLTNVKGAQSAGEIMLSAVSATNDVIAAVQAVRVMSADLAVLKGFPANAAATALKSASSALASSAAKAGAVGAAIGLVANWGLFFAAWGKGGLSTDSIAFNSLLAGAVATTLVIVLTFLISLTVVGAIVLAVVGIFDLIALIICKAGVKTACSLGITEALTKVMTDWLYTGGIMIDTNADPAITNIEDIQMRLARPDKGLVAGNSMRFDLTLLTVVRHAVPEPGIVYHYDNFFTAEDLRSTTVQYSLDKTERKLNVNLNQSYWPFVRSYSWVEAEVPSPVVGWLVPTVQIKNLYEGRRTDQLLSEPYPFTAPKINTTFPLSLNVGLALPRYDCWFQVCVHKTAKSSVGTDLGTGIVLDILPATLDEFVNWNDLGAQFDRDGDGLNIAQDPDSTKFDTDGDGLPDGVEYKYGTERGYGFNPRVADTDNDGLNDAEEVRYGTDPRKADTDGDGVSDIDESKGYTITLAGRTVFVTSNPLNRDGDHDGMSDGVERRLNTLDAARYPYNPQVFNDPPARVYSIEDDVDSVIAISDRIVISTMVMNGTSVESSLIASGQFSATLPTELGGATQRRNFTLLANTTSEIVLTGTASAGNRFVNVNTGMAAELYPVGNSPTGLLNDIILDSPVPVTIDNDPPDAPSITQGMFVQPGRSVVIGGIANDPTSYISKVEVNVNNSGFNTATGTALWAFPVNVPNTPSGGIPVTVRSSDAVNHTSTANMALTVDGVSPNLSVGIAPGSIRQVRRNAAGNWVLRVSGTATDATAGMASLSVQVGDSANRVFTPTVIQSNGQWSVDYEFDDIAFNADPRPTGPYTLTVVARDAALPDGNPTTQVIPFIIDMTPPVVNLLSHKSEQKLTDGAVITGIVTDTFAAVANVEVAFVSAQTALATERTLLRLPLNDLPQTVLFANKADVATRIFCLDVSCPTSGVNGADGTAVSFDGNDLLRTFESLSLPVSGTTTALWFNTANANAGLMTLVQGVYPAVVEHDRDLFLSGGKVCVDVKVGALREVRCSEAATYANGQWHHVVHSLGAGGNALYVDGQLAVSSPTTASVVNTQNHVLVGYAPSAATPFLTGALDDVTIYDSALPAQAAISLYRQWQPVTVTGNLWSYPIPSGLEGYYQIDMRATDSVGNRGDDRGDWPQFRGPIDTQFPTFDLNVTYSGSGSAAQTNFAALVRDANLTTDDYAFACPLTDGQKRYDTIAAQYGFVGTTGNQLTGIQAQCSKPGFQSSQVAARACDAYGHCASGTPPQTVAYVGTRANTLNPQGSLPNAIERTVLSNPQARVQVIKRVGQLITDIAIDETRGKIYWGEMTEGDYAQPGRIMRANLDGTNIETLINGLTVYAPEALQIAIDTVGNKVYWTKGYQLWWANLDGTLAQVVYAMPDDPRFVGGAREVNQIGDVVVDRANGKLYLSERRQRGDQAGYISGIRNFGQIFRHTLIVSADLNGTNPTFVAGAGPGCTYANFYQNVGSGVGQGQQPIVCLTAGGDGFDVESLMINDGNLYWSAIDVGGLTAGVYVRSVISGTSRVAPLNISGNSNGLRFAPVPQMYGAPGSSAVFIANGNQVLRGEPVGQFTVFGDFGAAAVQVNGQSTRKASELTAMAVIRTAQQLQTRSDLVVGITSPDLVLVSGQTGRYDITIGNTSAVPADNTSLTLTLPSGATFASASQTCTAQGVVVSCPLGRVQPYAQQTLNISFTIAVASVRPLTATVQIGTPLPDANVADNSASNTSVTAAPTLSALPGIPYIYAANYSHLLRVPLLGSDHTPEPVLLDNNGVGGQVIAADTANGKVLINDAFGKIARVNPNGTGYTVIADANPTQGPVHNYRLGIAIDADANRMYWTQIDTFYLSSIKSARLDGSDVRTVVPQVLNQRGLAIDLVRRRLLWVATDRSERQNHIYSSNLDGSGIEVIYSAQPGQQMRYLSINPYTQKLYWIDPTQNGGSLMWADSDGQRVTALKEFIGEDARGIVVRPLEDALYFMDGNVLARTRLDGSNSTAIATFDGARYAGVSNLNPSVFPYVFNAPPFSNLTLAFGTPFAPATCTTVDGNEPNDDAAQATPKGVGTFTAALCRSRSDFTTLDRDVYSVTVPSDQQITVTLHPPTDYNLYLQQSDVTLAVSQQTGNTPDVVTYANYSGSTLDFNFTVYAMGAMSVQPYTVTVELAPAPPQTVFSNAQCAAVDTHDAPGSAGNGTQANATALIIGTPITGALCYENDTDYYKFSGVTGQTLSVDLPLRPTANYAVYVYRPNGSLFNAYNATGVWRFNMPFVLDATGDWAVAVFDLDLTATLSQYQLMVSDVSCAQTDSNEPNNSSAAATNINGQSRVSATLCNAGDVDFYQFTATAGQQLTVNYPMDAVAANLTLQSETGATLGQVVSGTQRIFSLTDAGNYRLFIAKADLVGNNAPYMFQWQLGAPSTPATTTAYVYYSIFPQLFRVALSEDHKVEPMQIDNAGASGEVLAASMTLGKLYMVENTTQALISVDFDGRNRTVIIPNANPDGVGTTRIAVAVDDLAGRVYWLQPVGAIASTAVKLMSANLNGSDVQQLVTGIINQRGLLVDPVKGVLYWVAGEAIYRSKLDGSNVQTVRAAGVGEQVRDLSLDPFAQNLYWLDPGQQKLFRAKSDGSAATALASGLDSNVRGLALRPLDNELYFSNGAALMRATLALTPTIAIAALSGEYIGPSNLNPNANVQTPIGAPNSNLVIGQGLPILSPCALADSNEPNNSEANATVLNVVTQTVVYGAICNTVISPNSDTDYYSVTVPNGKVLSATLSQLPADYRLIILHPNGYAAAFSDGDGLADEFGVITNTSGTTMTYAVLVMSGFVVQNTEPYQLSVALGDVPPPPNPGDAACGLADPNDAPDPDGNGTLASATALQFGTPSVGALCYANDVDMYAFAGLADQSISIDLPTRPADYSLTLYDPSGAPTAIAYGTRLTLTVSGKFTVSVSQPSLVPTTDQYQLIVTDHNCVSDDAYEPNNLAAATLIDGSRVRASLCGNGDLDLYQVNAVAGQQLTVNYPVNAGEAQIQVAGSSGALGSVNPGTQGVFAISQSGLYTLSVMSSTLAINNVPYAFQVLLGAPTSPPTGTPYVYYGRVSDLVRADILSGTVEPLLTDNSVTGGTVLAADVGRGKLYMLDYFNHVVRVNFDGTGRSNVVPNVNPNNVLRPTQSLAVDELSGRIYWTEPLFGVVLRILSANGDGSDVRQVIASIVDDHGLAIDSVAGQLYWAETALYGGAVVDLIRRSDLDGENVQTVYAAPEGRQVRELSLDAFARKLYWRDPSQNKLLWLSMDGSGNPSTLSNVGNNARGFVLRPLQNELFFTNDTGLYKAALNGSNAQEVARLEGAYNGVSNLDGNVFYPTTITPPGSNLVLGYGQPFGQPCSAVDLGEPNNTPASATAIGTGVITAALCTQDLTKIDEMDFYSVTVAAGKQITVLLSNLPQNYGLSLLKNGVYVANSYQSGLVDELVSDVNTGNTALVYTVLVQRFGDTTSSRIPYRLTVTVGDAPPPPPPPPPPVDSCAAFDSYDQLGILGNGSRNNATLITFNTPITAALCYDNDRDYYAFDGVIGQNVKFDLLNRPADYYLTIYNPNGDYVTGIFPGSFMTYGNDLTLNMAGRWTVAVWDAYLVKTTAQYQLRLSVNTTCSGLDPYEPNDDQFNGYPVITRTFTLRSNLCELADVDYYSVPVVVGDRVRITPRQLTPGMEMVWGIPGGGTFTSRDGLDIIVNVAGNLVFGFISQETTENLPYEVDVQVTAPPAPIPQPNNWTCAVYTSTDVPNKIEDLVTLSSVLTVPVSGNVTHVSIKDLQYNHKSMQDLEFGLQSPDGTLARLLNFGAYNRFYTWCGGPDCRLSLDDAAIEGLIPPQFPNTGQTYRPNVGNFTPFNGKPSAGAWKLLVSDDRLSDPNDDDMPDTTGNLTGWGLEVCIDNGQPATPPPTPTATATPQPQPTNGTPVPTAVPTTATPTPTPLATTCALTADEFEPDDTAGNASAFNIANLSSGVRTFGSTTDADWMAFTALPNRVYTFTTNVIGSDAQVALAIYNNDGSVLIAAGDDQVVLPAGAGGMFLLRAKSAAGIQPTCSTSYNVVLVVIDPNAAPVPTPVGTPVPAGHTTPRLSAAVLQPAQRTVFTQTAPIAIQMGLNAQYTVAAASLLVNGVVVDDYAAPGNQTDAIWDTTWTPTSAGTYSLTVQITDTTNVTAVSPLHTLFVDLGNPTISIVSETITMSKLISTGAYLLHGTVSDDSQIALVEVSLNGGAWEAAVLDGSAWTLSFSPQALANPNGGTLAVNARATDRAGRTITNSSAMLVDVVPPDPFDVLPSLTNGTIISPSMVITSLNVQLTWPPIPSATQVFAGWTTTANVVLSALTAYGASGGVHDQSVTQGNLYYAHVVAVDANGNSTTHNSGPYYFDTAPTPDLIADLSQRNWVDSGGKQVGQMNTTNRGVQQLFVGWDASQLRLRWQGLNIDSDGDLYLYLGTGGTGSNDLFNPNGPSQSGVLPFAANYVLRIAGGISPTLLAYNGSAWVTQTQVVALSDGAATDVLVPFADLGISNPAAATLKILGVATDIDTLDVWATVPDKNLGQTWNQYVNLATLGANVTPADGVWADAQLDVVVSANPAPTQFVGVGDPISVTVTAKNVGTALLPSLTVSGTTSGGIVLNNSPQTAANVAVSGTASMTLTGIVNGNGTVALALADSYHRPYQLETLSYRVDVTAPVSVSLAISYAIIGRNVVFVSAQDNSPISQVDLEINGVIGTNGNAPTGSCTPTGSGYECVWNVGNVADGTAFSLRARATDSHGNAAWSNVVPVQVDATPPTLTLSAAALAVLSDGRLSNKERALSGTLIDTRAAARTELCSDNSNAICETQMARPDNSWTLSAPALGDGVTTTLAFVGFDLAGNSSQVISVPVLVDTVGPTFGAATYNPSVTTSNSAMVLGSGTVNDGDAVANVQLFIVRPNGSSTIVSATLNGTAWTASFVFDLIGDYQVIVVAADRAGNKSTQVIGQITATSSTQPPTSTATPTATALPITLTPMPTLTLTATPEVPSPTLRLFLPLVQRQNPLQP